MPANFSPTAQAARLLAARSGSAPSGSGSTPPMSPASPAVTGQRWCEWPRRTPATPRFTSIRQALLAIQARHA